MLTVENIKEWRKINPDLTFTQADENIFNWFDFLLTEIAKRDQIIADVEKVAAIEAFSNGYHAGHDDTVEGCFMWCKDGTKEKAEDWANDHFDLKGKGNE